MPPSLPLLLALALAPRAAASAEGYFWPKRGGTHVGHGAVAYAVPANFSKGPSWTWENEDDELFRHGPVIDGNNNIYAATSRGIVRKFSPDGSILWIWRTTVEEGKVVVSPFLSDGKLFISSFGPWYLYGSSSFIYALDMETGRPLYKAAGPKGGVISHDSSTLHVAEGILLGASISHQRLQATGENTGTNMIWAANASDGSHLWDFVLDDGALVWNFMPSTPGDGSFFFSSCCGVAQRRWLTNGSLAWKSPLADPGGFCSTGGGTLGPNGVFYAVANHALPPHVNMLPNVAPCTRLSCVAGRGIVVASRAEDGAVLWARRLGPDWGGWQYPTVAEVGGRLALVAGIGTNPAIPTDVMGPRFLPNIVQRAIARLQLRWAGLRRYLRIPLKRNAVAAYDAGTGEQLWLWEEEPWSYFGAKGDEDRLPERGRLSMIDPRIEPLCGPDNWGIPAVIADGTVVIGSGNSGNLYAIRDLNGDGEIQDGEVSTLRTESAFLNGPALAPGMLVAAPCWGKMYVFRIGAT